jgi:hypothetical protein
MKTKWVDRAWTFGYCVMGLGTVVSHQKGTYRPSTPSLMLSHESQSTCPAGGECECSVHPHLDSHFTRLTTPVSRLRPTMPKS